MVNINKLKGKIVERGTSTEALARAIGIDKSTLYRKLQAGESFTIKEADEIAKALELEANEATAIFFSQFVA